MPTPSTLRGPRWDSRRGFPLTPPSAGGCHRKERQSSRGVGQHGVEGAKSDSFNQGFSAAALPPAWTGGFPGRQYVHLASSCGWTPSVPRSRNHPQLRATVPRELLLGPPGLTFGSRRWRLCQEAPHPHPGGPDPRGMVEMRAKHWLQGVLSNPPLYSWSHVGGRSPLTPWVSHPTPRSGESWGRTSAAAVSPPGLPTLGPGGRAAGSPVQGD